MLLILYQFSDWSFNFLIYFEILDSIYFLETFHVFIFLNVYSCYLDKKKLYEILAWREDKILNNEDVFTKITKILFWHFYY